MPVLRQTADYCLVAEGMSEPGPLVLKTLCQHCQQVLCERLVDLDATLPSDVEAALMGAMDAAQALAHACPMAFEERQPRTWDEETGGAGALRLRVAMTFEGFCQGNVQGCEAEEWPCVCGVITCEMHGHVDEGDDPHCPLLVANEEGIEMGTNAEDREDEEQDGEDDETGEAEGEGEETEER
jgi:hypothetical protein